MKSIQFIVAFCLINICLSMTCCKQQTSLQKTTQPKMTETTYETLETEVVLTGKLLFQPSIKSADCYCAGNAHYYLDKEGKRYIFKTTASVTNADLKQHLNKTIKVQANKLSKKIPNPSDPMVAHPISEKMDEKGNLVPQDYFECTIFEVQKLLDF